MTERIDDLDEGDFDLLEEPAEDEESLA